MLRNTELPPDQWASALVETFFSKDSPLEIVREAVSIVSDLHPGATRVALQAFAEADLRDVLPCIDVPTLVLCGEEDGRAPRPVWEALHSGIRGSRLVLIPGVGHVIDIEAADRVGGRSLLGSAHVTVRLRGAGQVLAPTAVARAERR